MMRLSITVAVGVVVITGLLAGLLLRLNAPSANDDAAIVAQFIAFASVALSGLLALAKSEGAARKLDDTSRKIDEVPQQVRDTVNGHVDAAVDRVVKECRENGTGPPAGP
jgi:glucose dehydrogenase